MLSCYGYTDWKTALLAQVLDCGTRDVEILRDCNYDIGEICQNLFEDGIRPTLNNILHDIFAQAKSELIDAVHGRICDLETENYLRDLTEEEQKDLALLRSLCPEKDVTWEVNSVCSYLYLDRREEYLYVLQAEIEQIENNCGFEFWEGCD